MCHLELTQSIDYEIHCYVPCRVALCRVVSCLASKKSLSPAQSRKARWHYGDVIMGTIIGWCVKITSLTIVYSTVRSGADQRKHQSSTLLVFVLGIHGDSPHKWPVARKMFPFDDVIMGGGGLEPMVPIAFNPDLVVVVSSSGKRTIILYCALSCFEWGIVGYGTDAFWDLRIGSIAFQHCNIVTPRAPFINVG